MWDVWSKTTYLVPRLGRGSGHVDIGLLTRLREDVGDDAGALCGIRVGAFMEVSGLTLRGVDSLDRTTNWLIKDHLPVLILWRHHFDCLYGGVSC